MGHVTAIVVPEPGMNLLFATAFLGFAAYALLIATGTIETDRWLLDEHPEFAYLPAAMGVIMAVIALFTG
jgi:hypothetical protein